MMSYVTRTSSERSVPAPDGYLNWQQMMNSKATSLTALSASRSLFWNNCCSDCCKLLVNFQSSLNVYSDNVLVAFRKVGLSEGSYSAFSLVPLPYLVLLS